MKGGNSHDVTESSKQKTKHNVRLRVPVQMGFRKKQSKSTRKLIGKIDPKTGEIIQTGPRGRKKSQKSCRKKNGEAVTPEKKPNYKSLYLKSQEKIKEQNDMIIELKIRVADLEIELRSERGILAQIRELANK